ncbi:hypothetical protein D3C81_1555330 [compost metagenome]
MRTGDELDGVDLLLLAVEDQRAFRVDGASQAQVVRHALGQVDVVQGARQLHGFQLDDVELLGILDDVGHGGLVAGAGLELDQPGLLQ